MSCLLFILLQVVFFPTSQFCDILILERGISLLRWRKFWIISEVPYAKGRSKRFGLSSKFEFERYELGFNQMFGYCKTLSWVARWILYYKSGNITVRRALCCNSLFRTRSSCTVEIQIHFITKFYISQFWGLEHASNMGRFHLYSYTGFLK